MSTTKIRHGTATDSQLVDAPGWSVEIDEFGMWTAVTIKTGDRFTFWQYVPTRHSPHPELPFLRLEKNSITYDTNDIVRVTSMYVGIREDGESIPVIVWTGESAEEPIATHPNFKIQRAGFSSSIEAAAGDGGILWANGDNNVFQEFTTAAQNNLTGVSGYINAQRARVTKTYVAGSPPSTTNDGRIYTYTQLQETEPINPYSKWPTISSGYNFLKMPTVYEERGEVYRVTETWTMSDEKGWNPFIYRVKT